MSRLTWVWVLLLLSTLTILLGDVSQGSVAIAPFDLLKALFHVSANPDHQFIVQQLRLPRVLVGWGVGAALALAGTLIQSLTRNPLASPSVLGVNGGASLGAVLWLWLAPSTWSAGLPLAALVGAGAIALLLLTLTGFQTRSGLRLILIGVGLNLMAGAGINLAIALGNLNTVRQGLVWLTGSVYGRSWSDVALLFPTLLGLGTLAIALRRELDTLQLGRELATGLGVAVERQQRLLLWSAMGLAAVAVAIAGNLAFVGLIAPHLGRQLVGARHTHLLPVAMVLGGLLVTLADTLGRLLFAPQELPCGLLTAAIGAPYFLVLLARSRQ
jgi:iron complex transport system permease protein